MTRKPADSYTASVARLKALVGRLESAEVDVDELEAVVRESVQLVTTCRTRLRATQSGVDTLLVGLQEETAPSPPRAQHEPAATPTPSKPAAAAPPTVDLLAALVADEDPFAEE